MNNVITGISPVGRSILICTRSTGLMYSFPESPNAFQGDDFRNILTDCDGS